MYVHKYIYNLCKYTYIHMQKKNFFKMMKKGKEFTFKKINQELKQFRWEKQEQYM